MASKGNQIEKLIAEEKWGPARMAIEKRLVKEPDNHWLWSRLSAVKYEQGDYAGALADAKKALEIVPDCPLAKWDYAGALDMLGKPEEALMVYGWLFARGFKELETPDEDAEECWEGKDWTNALITDCVFRVADCTAKMGNQDAAEDFYHIFLALVEKAPGIYSRKDAEARLEKLQQQKAELSPRELRQEVERKMKELVEA